MSLKVIADLEEEIKKRDIPIRILRKILRKVKRFDLNERKTDNKENKWFYT